MEIGVSAAARETTPAPRTPGRGVSRRGTPRWRGKLYGKWGLTPVFPESRAKRGFSTASLAVTGFGMQLQPKCPNDFKDCVEARATLAGKRLVKAFAGQPGIARDL